MELTLQDQERINTFSRLNALSHDLEARITVHKAVADDCEEAGNELMLLDDEEVPYSIGECFVRIPREDAEQRLERAQDEARKETKKLDNERRGVKSEMDDLKKVLYAKFGDSINLDE